MKNGVRTRLPSGRPSGGAFPPARALGLSVLVGLALGAASSGCELLEGIQLPAATESCTLDTDCPSSQWCVGLVCRDACDDGRCRAGTSCQSANGHDVCMASDDAGMLVSDAAMAPEAQAGQPDAGTASGCSQCDPASATCIDGVCRVLSWSTPQTQNAEPVPAPESSRVYVGVPRNLLYAQHISIPQAGFVVKLGVLVSTAPALVGALIGMSLYSDARHYPLAPIVEPPVQATVAQADDSGRQEFALDPPVHVAAGDYWLVFFAPTRAYNVQGTGASIETAEEPATLDAGPWLTPFPLNADPPLAMADQAIIVYATVAMDP